MREAEELFAELDLDAGALKQGDLAVHSPIDGREIARVQTTTPALVDEAIARVHQAFLAWRRVPPPPAGPAHPPVRRGAAGAQGGPGRPGDP